MKAYVVMNEGEMVYASYERDEAEEFARNKNEAGTDEALLDMGIDDPTDKDMAEASFVSGFYGEYHEVFEVDTDEANEHGEIELLNCDIITVSELEKILK